MAINYKTYEFRCYECIRQLEGLLQFDNEQQELQEWRIAAEQLRKNLEFRRFRVAVVGEFNRGKTSFVNALLGKEILPADYMPTTATINRITYGDTPSAYVLLKSGEKEYVQISELAGYITKLSASALETALTIEEAVVQYPSLFCRNGVDLLDTPGMNDEQSMNQITVSRLEDIDLAIIAVDASMPFSMTERAFTIQLLESPQICQIIVVITKIDMIRQSEQQKLIDFMIDRIKTDIMEYLEQSYKPDDPIMEKYHIIFDAPCVFAVSSLDALDALARNDMELFEKSGFLRLNDELPQIILSSQNSNVIFNSMRILLGLIRSYEDWLLNRQKLFRNLIPQLEAVESSFSAITKKYYNAALNAGQPIPFDLNQYHSSIRKRFIQALSEMKVLHYDELQKVMFPAVKETFQLLHTSLRSQETAYLDNYRDSWNQAGIKCVEEVCSLMHPFPLLRQCIQPELDAVLNSFSIPENKPAESFYWVYSPVPDAKSLGPDWKVMPFVDTVIRSSLQNYQIRQKEELAKLFGLWSEQLSDRLNTINAQLHNKLQTYAESLNGKEEQEVFNALQKLEETCKCLVEQFQTELHKNVP